MFQIRKARLIRSAALVGLYSAVALTAFAGAFYVRFDGSVPIQYQVQLVQLLGIALTVQVGVLMAWGQTQIVASYFSMVDLRAVVLANIVSCGLLFTGTTWFGVRIPRGVVMLDFILLTGGIAVARAGLRHVAERRRESSVGARNGHATPIPVAIVGAGDAGARVVRELLSKPSLRLKPVVFFDDDAVKWGQRLHGIAIAGKPERMREEPWRQQLRKVIVAAPSATPARLGEIARLAAELGIPSDTLPALDQLVDGTVKVSQLRPVRIDDLLRREAVALDHEAIRLGIRGQVVVVTGAGGSIGSELCRQILRAGPRQLLLLERSEVQLFQIEQELLEQGGRNIIVPLVADVADPCRVREIFQRHRPSVLFHAAAHKHVPMMEGQPSEAIRNNSFGTANLARLAHEFQVDRFVLISTDKAINPTNVMGASKRMAEIFLQAFQATHPSPTRFMAVRFGNVLGSSGSVVPTFQKQIAAGGPVTVTHPDVTRYFMTIPEAVGLVLQAGTLGRGGEIFVLDMGEPVKVVDLARQMIQLSGYQPDEDIEIRFVGLRPGEKMFEELSHHREQLTETGHPKIFRFVSEPMSLVAIEDHFQRIHPRLGVAEPGDLKRLIQEVVPEYKPFLS